MWQLLKRWWEKFEWGKWDGTAGVDREVDKVKEIEINKKVGVNFTEFTPIQQINTQLENSSDFADFTQKEKIIPFTI